MKAEEIESRPTWLSILLPGLGDYINNNPKLATFWFGSTLFVGAIHKNSVDNLHTQRGKCNKVTDFGLFY
ncbi:MAG: hypothetical protein H7A23_14505 [Leptospiraceae bacterium]|nr:hypothetical protein [Leptospiraceae bacterium]MCP5495763.1 hypothetical protein [Leptospiraceae bacterium]